jgi:hypothetical protein
MSTVRHGEYAGAMWHQKHGVPKCPECKEAARQYKAEWRAKDPGNRQSERDINNAASRALWRLADLHPTEFAALVAEERAKIKPGARR